MNSKQWLLFIANELAAMAENILSNITKSSLKMCRSLNFFLNILYAPKKTNRNSSEPALLTLAEPPRK